MILSNGVQQRFCIHKFRSLGSDCLVSMLLARYISFCDACFIVLYTLPTTSYLTVSILASVGIAHLAYYAVLFHSLLPLEPPPDLLILTIVIHIVLCEQLIPSMYHLHCSLPIVACDHRSGDAMLIDGFRGHVLCCCGTNS